MIKEKQTGFVPVFFLEKNFKKFEKILDKYRIMWYNKDVLKGRTRKEKEMKKYLTEERANELKNQGITHIASIVKSHFDTRYYKYESIETILANNGKMPEYVSYNGFVHGYNGNHIDWNHTIRWSEI